MSDQRSRKHEFKFGKYTVYSIPRNVVVGEWSIVQEGKMAGMEKVRENSKTFHSNYERALENLVDRLIKDGMSGGSLNMLKDLIESIQNVKKEVIQVLREQGIKENTT